MSAGSAVKPIMAAGLGSFLLNRSGFGLANLPVVSGFVQDDVDDESELAARYICCFGRRKRVRISSEDDATQEEGSADVGLPYVIPLAVTGLGVLDLYLGGVLLHSLSLPVDQPLKEWVLGALLLGFPTSALTYNIAQRVSFKHAFLFESVANFASFGWLSAGMLWVSKSAAYKTAPLLFWSVYLLCVTSWSVMGTSMLGLIITTVVAILFSNKQPALS